MQEYRKVIEFYYNNSSYIMYLDNNNRHYFLKKNHNDLLYPNLLELIELTYFFNTIPKSLCIEKNMKNAKFKFIPKVIINGSAVILSLSIISLGIAMYQSQERLKKYDKENMNQSIEINQPLQDGHSIENYISYDSNENLESKELVADTYLESDWLNYIYIYDMNYLNKYFDYDNVNINQVKEMINSNSKISTKYKNLLFDYCDAIIKKYPNIELRVLYENLKTLEVVECDKNELITHTLSVDSYGCYVRSENKIYVLDGYEFEPMTWAYQVIFHEFSHCLRTGNYVDGDKKIKIQVEGQNYSNTITAEALNSLFTVSLFDYEEKDIAYQLQSNYHKIMIECMDNYSLEDYINHSLSYYAIKLDEFNNDENYATIILDLIETQYKDYHSKSMYVEQSEYYPIYDYISNMYYKKYITKDMTYQESLDICEELIQKITYDVPEDYNINTERFYQTLDNYCEKLNINKNTKSR